MSTTNPSNPGGHPGAGRRWPADVGQGARADDHGGGGGVDPAALKAGHEPDAFAVRPLMSVPLAVVVAFVIAFAVAGGAFYLFRAEAQKLEPFAHPEAVAQSQSPLNDRLSRTERAGLEKNKAREFDQPRLEPLRRLEESGQFYARPPLPTGNSPEIHWEDIRPDRVPELQTAGYRDHDKKHAHIPISDAMKFVAEHKDALPVSKEPSKPVGTDVRPSASSGGKGVLPPLPKEPQSDKKDEKKEPPKADAQPKKDQPPAGKK